MRVIYLSLGDSGIQPGRLAKGPLFVCGGVEVKLTTSTLLYLHETSTTPTSWLMSRRGLRKAEPAPTTNTSEWLEKTWA